VLRPALGRASQALFRKGVVATRVAEGGGPRWHTLCRGLGALTEHLEEEHGARDRGVEARHSPHHGDADVEVDPAADRGREALPFAPYHEADRPAKVRAAVVLRRLRLGSYDPNPSESEGCELVGEALYSGDEKVFNGASTRLDRRGRERSRATGRHQDAVHSDRLGTADQAPEILRIFDPVESQDEGGFATTHGPRKDLFWGNLWPASHHQRNTLMPVEAGELTDERAFDLDDGNPQRCGMQHHLLQRSATLRYDEQLQRLATGAERLFYWMSPCDQLLIGTDQGERLCRNRALRGPVTRTFGSRSPTASY